MNTAVLEKIYRTIPFEIRSIDTEARTFQAVASDPTVDRHGESISQDGWELGNFIKNPVILLNHDYDGLPVAQAINVGFDKEGRLVFTPKFATADEYDLADTVFKLYQGGYMRAFSVGFIPLDAEWDKVNETYTYTRMELLEISAVTVPSNPNALALAYKEGIVTETDRKKLIATHKSIVKSLTEVVTLPHTESIDEDEEVTKELEETINRIDNRLEELGGKVDTLVAKDALVSDDGEVRPADERDANKDAKENGDLVEKPSEEVVVAGDKSAEEIDADGAQDDEVSDEEAQKIIDETVKEALDAAKGKVT